MQLPESQETLVTMANAAELAAAVALGVVGTDVADTINRSPLTREVLCNLFQVKAQQHFAKELGGLA